MVKACMDNYYNFECNIFSSNGNPPKPDINRMNKTMGKRTWTILRDTAQINNISHHWFWLEVTIDFRMDRERERERTNVTPAEWRNRGKQTWCSDWTKMVQTTCDLRRTKEKERREWNTRGGGKKMKKTKENSKKTRFAMLQQNRARRKLIQRKRGK